MMTLRPKTDLRMNGLFLWNIARDENCAPYHLASKYNAIFGVTTI